MSTLSRMSAVAGATLLLVGLGALAAVRLTEPPSDSAYVGSSACSTCHEAEFELWDGSEHTRMMRPASTPGLIIAPVPEPALGASPIDEAVWVIGGKWEQQFMGQSPEGQTLLPGAWLRLAGRWDFRNWDGWQAPDPLRRCHGCHTVGLDTESGRFVEPNIGCESCHGPGSWHVSTWGLGRIHAGTESEICGQCHARGTTHDGSWFFPVSYRPGDSLDEHFRFTEPSITQNSSHWWGSGHERKRHQEYQAWRVGGHANALRTLLEGYDGQYGPVAEDCLECHSAEYALSGYRKPSLDEVRLGVTCAVCHNVHGDLARPRRVCSDCHVKGPYQHRAERNADHVACPEWAGVGCVDCHMPRTVQTGGAFALRSHRPGFVSRADGERWGMPTGCSSGSCHEAGHPGGAVP